MLSMVRTNVWTHVSLVFNNIMGARSCVWPSKSCVLITQGQSVHTFDFHDENVKQPFLDAKLQIHNSHRNT